MIKNNGKKLKSAFVVLALLLTALTVSMFSNVTAKPGGFAITAPTTGTYCRAGRPLVITWGAANASGTIGYNVTINGTTLVNSLNDGNNLTALTFTWDTTYTAIGTYLVGVTAWNYTNGANHTPHKSTNNMTVYITAGIPGRDIWYGGNNSVTGTNNVTLLYGSQAKAKVLNTSTQNLKFGYTDDIVANTSAGKGWTAATSYYLFYPVYKGGDQTAFNLTWALYAPEGVPIPKITTGTSDNTFESVTLNRSGLWIIDDSTGIPPVTDANMSTITKQYMTTPGWFWVNSSPTITVESDTDTLTYGENKKITITTSVAAVVDVRAFSNNQTVFAQNEYTGSDKEFSFWTNNTMTHKGKYEVYAYKDDDLTVQYWDVKAPKYYDNNYGNGTITYAGVGPYDYALCGPYDPPEYTQVAKDTITVSTGKPTITLSNASSNIYWGFEARVDINVTNPATGKGLTGGISKILIKNVEGDYIGTTHPSSNASFMITEIGNGNYSFNISRGAAFWKTLYTTYCNGTWRVFYSYDADADGDYEWNNSAAFQVGGTPPSARIVMDDDGNGTKTDKKIDIPTYTGAGVGPANAQTILFTVYGSTVTGAVTDYYGDNVWERANAVNDSNITLTGDILYPVDYLNLHWVSGGQWTARVTPTKPGGTINIAVDWNTTNTVLEETINIINGSTVTTSTDIIYVGEHTNLTVYVKDMDGDPVKTATVYLFEKGLGAVAINSTTGTNAEGNGKDGAYTFWILPTNFTTAPDNITIAAMWATGRWGYANVKVEKQHTMMVNVTPTTSYAGDGTEYTVTVSLVGGGAPEEDAKLFVGLYNETGVVVTGVDTWPPWSELEHTETKSLTAGTYYLYAYNDTSDSRGYNATIIVTPYSVESNPAMLAWLIDTEQNMTFQVTPAGNGSLILKNMTALPNCSAGGMEHSIQVTNGIATLNNVNATCLGNVTYEYTPDSGERRPAEGLLMITTAVATPNPATIYTNDGTTEVIITVTHPATGVPLEDVRVSLDNDKNATTSILAKIPDAEMTDANGIATFGLMPQASGEIMIYLKNGSDPNNEYIITSATRKTMTLSHAPSVDEGDEFTVTALYNGEPITDTTVTISFAGDDWTTTTGIVEITAPSDLEESYDWPLVANAEGYTMDVTSLIRVINKPNIYLTITETTWTSGSKYVVKAGADNGNSYGITVILTDASGVTTTLVTAGPDGVTFTAPKVTKDTTYTISAEKAGYVFDPTTAVTITVKPGGIPGFELITLIAAIGVAFILLRRRRN